MIMIMMMAMIHDTSGLLLSLSKNIYDTQREIDKLVNDRERVLTGVAGEAEV
jgi:cell division protein FtsL